MQVHGVRSQLEVPAVLHDVDERFHKVGVVQLIVAANLVDVLLIKFPNAGVILDTVQEFIDTKLGIDHDIVAFVNQAADFDRFLCFLIGKMAAHDGIFGFGDTDGDGEIVLGAQFLPQTVAAGNQTFGDDVIRLVVLDDESGAVGKLCIQYAFEEFAEMLERIIEYLIVVLFNILAVLFVADVEVLNFKIVDVNNNGGIIFFTEVPAIDFAALDDLLQAFDVVKDDVLDKAVAVTGFNLHIGDVFLRNQL